MSATSGLLLLLAILYLSDCLWWLPYNAIVFESRWLGGGWRIRGAGGDFGNDRHSLVALAPLPFAVALQLEPQPWSVSPRGLLAWSSAAWSPAGRPRQPGWSKSWEEIDTIEAVGHALMIDGLELHRFSLKRDARAAAARLDELRRADPDRREEMIVENWRGELDREGLVDRLDTAADEAKPLRIAGAALWFAMFLVAPAAGLLLGGSKVLLVVAALLLVLVSSNVALHRSRHRRHFPDERWRRNELSLLMCLSWPMAARSADLLTRHRLADVHPFALSLALDEASGNLPLVKRVLRDISNPLTMIDLDEPAREIADWEGRHRGALLWSAARQAGIEMDEDTEPPREDDAEAFCPRCWDTFVLTEVECSNCPGVSSRPFDG